MDLNPKLKLLDRIYQLYDDIIAPCDLACGKFCSDCCTRNVTLTTLEGYRIINRLLTHDQMDFLQKVRADRLLTRFRPGITTNEIARLCAAEEDAPDEEINSDWGVCPLLERNLCRIYTDRPFGCRCLVSSKKCAETGYADVDEFLLSVNTVFLQYIEHLDTGGRFGNLTDILLLLEPEQNRLAYESGILSESSLPANQPIPSLFIPPEYRERMKPILKSLQAL